MLRQRHLVQFPPAAVLLTPHSQSAGTDGYSLAAATHSSHELCCITGQTLMSTIITDTQSQTSVTQLRTEVTTWRHRMNFNMFKFNSVGKKRVTARILYCSRPGKPRVVLISTQQWKYVSVMTSHSRLVFQGWTSKLLLFIPFLLIIIIKKL